MPRLRDAWFAGASLAVAGCAAGPDYVEPAAPPIAAFAERGQVNAVEAAPDPEWWTQFRDPVLDELVAAAIVRNRDLAAATARLKAARAQRTERLFDFFPTIRAGGGWTKSRQSQATVVPGSGQPRDTELYDAGFDATWELDLFGRVRRLNESARARAQAADAARDAVLVSVIAEVARNYLELRGAQSRLAVARNNADNQRRALDLVRARLDAGRGTGLDTARAQAQLSSTLASIPPLEADIARGIRRIEVLVGEVPGTRTAALATPTLLPDLPARLALGTPEDLLRRRPDVRTAERQLAATTAEIGVAASDYFPRITVSASAFWQAARVSDLDARGNDGYVIAPAFTWSALDFGRVRQQVKGARATTEATLADYEQVVLAALEETENTLSQYGRERARLEHLDRAAVASAQAAGLAAQRFEGGVSDFLTVIDANRAQLEAEDLLAASETRAATALVALYKALGGGWQVAPPPDP